MVVDTGKLSDLKTELEQACADLDYLIQNSGDEAKAAEVANSLDELVEMCGDCSEMLTDTDAETDRQIREGAGVPVEEAAPQESAEPAK